MSRLIRILWLCLLLPVCGCASWMPLPSSRVDDLYAQREPDVEHARTAPAWLTGTIESLYESPREPPATVQLPPQQEESVPDRDLRPTETLRVSVTSWLGRVEPDHRNFYTRDSLLRLGGGTMVAGVLANTSLDEDIHSHFQASVAGARSDDWFESLHAPKPLGNGMVTLPLFALAWGAGALFDDTTAGSLASEWGARSLRTFVVGAPPLLVMQYVTGGSRPDESSYGSSWRPFQDDNGASGHAFMGALPFLSAAKMTDNPWLKLALYGSSTSAGLSRVNDGDHYASQAILGWWIAYLAADAVDRTQSDPQRWSIVPYPDPHTTGLGMQIEF